MGNENGESNTVGIIATNADMTPEKVMAESNKENRKTIENLEAGNSKSKPGIPRLYTIFGVGIAIIGGVAVWRLRKR